MADGDHLDNLIPGHAMKFIRNGDEHREDSCLIEKTDSSDAELELAFTLNRDRYYLRVRKADLRRLLRDGGAE